MNSDGSPLFLLRLVFLGCWLRYAKIDNADGRLLQLSDIRWREEVPLLQSGAGSVHYFGMMLIVRFVGGASCMCIAASVAELVSAYPVCCP